MLEMMAYGVRRKIMENKHQNNSVRTCLGLCLQEQATVALLPSIRCVIPKVKCFETKLAEESVTST